LGALIVAVAMLPVAVGITYFEAEMAGAGHGDYSLFPVGVFLIFANVFSFCISFLIFVNGY
jgi:hypothetical protein